MEGFLRFSSSPSSGQEKQCQAGIARYHAKSLQSCRTLCDLMDCRPPGSSVHGFLQARILEWVAISFSRGSSQPRDWTWVSISPALAGGFLTTSTTWEAMALPDVKEMPNHRYPERSLVIRQKGAGEQGGETALGLSLSEPLHPSSPGIQDKPREQRVTERWAYKAWDREEFIVVIK